MRAAPSPGAEVPSANPVRQRDWGSFAARRGTASHGAIQEHDRAKGGSERLAVSDYGHASGRHHEVPQNYP